MHKRLETPQGPGRSGGETALCSTGCAPGEPDSICGCLRCEGRRAPAGPKAEAGR
jgi:hypothetical protein